METYDYRVSATLGESTVYEGQVLTFRRAFFKSVIRIENMGCETARFKLKWLDDVTCLLEDEKPTVFCLAAGSTLEFDSPETDYAPLFLDVIVVEHLGGSTIALTCEVPIESLN